jgi:hypothetical protein
LDHQALLVVRHDAAALAELRRQLPPPPDVGAEPRRTSGSITGAYRQTGQQLLRDQAA